MHAAAQKVVMDLGGEFPRTAGGLAELPGVGRYTAAAIASIAFGEPIAVVDGNVERVLSRVLAQDLRNRDVTWEYAERLLARDRAGDWNQAVMELGATVCLPADPKCLTCPLRESCGDPGRETKKQKPERQKRELRFRLAHRRGSVYLVQRAATDKLMAGMWELPSWPEQSGGEVVHRGRHSITTNDYAVSVVVAQAPELKGGKWVRQKKLPELALTGLTRKILRATNLWPSEGI
jgi:A/G-specific adenine glycosylase